MTWWLQEYNFSLCQLTPPPHCFLFSLVWGFQNKKRGLRQACGLILGDHLWKAQKHTRTHTTCLLFSLFNTQASLCTLTSWGLALCNAATGVPYIQHLQQKHAPSGGGLEKCTIVTTVVHIFKCIVGSVFSLNSWTYDEKWWQCALICSKFQHTRNGAIRCVYWYWTVNLFVSLITMLECLELSRWWH